MEMYGKNLRRSKKGSLIDILFIGVALTFFAIVVLIGLKVATEFENNIDANPLFADGEAREHVESVRVKYTNTIDNTFLFLPIFLSIASLILASLVLIHPMFIPLYFIGWVLVIYFAGIMSNMYQALAADANLVAIANDLTFMSNIMVALPIIVGVLGIFMMIVLYKIRSNRLE